MLRSQYRYKGERNILMTLLITEYVCRDMKTSEALARQEKQRILKV